MTIGTGIFLAAIIFLYLQTKDRWSWNKILKRSFLGIFIISITGAVAALISNYYRENPGVINEFKEVRLGSTKEDVLFMLGKPLKESDQTEKKKGCMTYTDVSVCFMNNKVETISYICKEHDSTNVNGIYCGDRSDKIINKFGKNVEIKNIPDFPFSRYYRTTKHNVEYLLSQNEVLAIIIEDFKTNKKEIVK